MGDTPSDMCRPAGAQIKLSPCVAINISPRWGLNTLTLNAHVLSLASTIKKYNNLIAREARKSERDSSGTTERHEVKRNAVKVMERIARRERTSAPLVRSARSGSPKTFGL
jgi:hypothetical protein